MLAGTRRVVAVNGQTILEHGRIPRQEKYDPSRQGLFWDDLRVGDALTDCEDDHVTVTAEMVRQFAHLTGDFNPIHVDPEFARTTVHRRMLVHGALLTSIALGQYNRAGYTYGTTIALVSCMARYVDRAFIGDRVYARFLVTKLDDNPHPRRGRAWISAWVRRYPDERIAAEMDMELIVARRRDPSRPGGRRTSGEDG